MTVLPDVLDTKVGLLVAPDLATQSGLQRWAPFGSFGSRPGVGSVGDQVVAAARDVLTAIEATIARQVLAADLEILTDHQCETGIWKNLPVLCLAPKTRGPPFRPRSGA
jgi:transposase